MTTSACPQIRRSTAPILLLGLVFQVVPIVTGQVQTATVAAEQDEPDSDVITLAPFEVLSEKGTRGYATANAMGGTRINVPISDTPQAVVSLNQEFLKDLNPGSFADALRFVSGISKVEGEYSGLISIRGIQSDAIGFRDAIADDLTAPLGGTLPDPIEVERLEVIKGPAGVLYGSHGFGGVINRVSKRPMETRRTEIGTEFTGYSDSEGYFRTYLDTTGPAGTNKNLLYRVMAAYQDGTNHMHGGMKRQTVIGVLEYRPSSQTSVWGRVRHSDDAIFVAQDLFTDSQTNMPFGYMPRNAYVGNFYGDDQVDSTEIYAFEAGATQTFDLFGSQWNARLLGRYNDGVAQRRTYIASGGLFYKNGTQLVVGTKSLTTANSTWTEAAAAGFDDIRENILRRDIRNGESDSWSLNFDLSGDINVGPTRHRVLLFAGTSEGEAMQHRFRENWIAPKPSIFTKTSVPPESVLNGLPQTLNNEWTTTDTKRSYVALQDNISLYDDRLIIVGALRYDSGTTGVYDNRLNVKMPNEKTTHWTPTYGVVGKPAKGVSLFLIHSETFQPQGGVNQAGERLRPLIGENDEVGIKLDLHNQRLVMTGSYFDMSQENSFIKVIFPDGSFDFQQVPLSNTKGWEIDLAAQPTDSLSLMVAYQWLDAKTQNGIPVRNVPQGGTYKAVLKYSFLNGGLEGLQVGANYEHINDKRSGDTNNTFSLPGYDLLGFFANYKWRGWRFQLNVENLTDEWYVAGATARQFMRSGPPRYYKLSVSRTF